MYDGFGPVLGTSASHWGFMVPATTAQRFEIPGGAPFTALNLWTTSGDDPKDNTAPASNGVIVTVVSS